MTRSASSRKAGWLVAASGLAALGLASSAHASGFYLQEQSAKAVGRAFSGEAADQGPESLWWNPAAIAGQTHSSAYISGSEILPSGKAVDNGSLIIRPASLPASVGGNPVKTNPLKAGFLPSGGFSMPLNDRVTIGLAITSPFSFQTEYDSASWARYSALKTSLTTIDVQPTIAVAATPWLRLGVGLNAEYSDATLSNALPNLSSLLPDGSQQLKGNGWNYGWSVGAQAHNDRLTVGFAYKSSIRHELGGVVTVAGLLGPLAGNNMVVSAKATFNTPWQATLGARY